VTGATLGFWAVALVLLGASLATVLTPNLFHAVLYLAAALVATALVFLLLDAPFLFGVQLLLYAGGVVTVLVFAIMLTERLVGERIRQTSRFLAHGGVVAAAVFVGVVGFVGRAAPGPPAPPASDLLTGLARALVGPYAAALELLGVLLVAALLGALYFARAED
jgi:NADH-quinone oxidoreductase subunit J